MGATDGVAGREVEDEAEDTVEIDKIGSKDDRGDETEESIEKRREEMYEGLLCVAMLIGIDGITTDECRVFLSARPCT